MLLQNQPDRNPGIYLLLVNSFRFHGGPKTVNTALCKETFKERLITVSYEKGGLRVLSCFVRFLVKKVDKKIKVLIMASCVS